jgi:glycosyltransferase involved in cell wall biosynthesis
MSEIQPLVGIGIPTYNRPVELRRTLEGIVGQTYTNLEIIVSDNASPGDLTEAVVREFMHRDPRIKFFRQTENRGAASNFQFVLEKATGDFFMWAADDDYRAPTFVEVLVDLLLQCPECAISFCDFMEVDTNGVKAEGYPCHYPLLRPFATGRSHVRLLKYFLQLESTGKANLIYGLMRRDALSHFNWNKFANRHGNYGVDMLFVFSILYQGRLALADQLLYRCTVGNGKEYASLPPRSLGRKIVEPLIGLVMLLHYTAQYLQIASGWMRVVLLILWPAKAMDVIVRIFLTTEVKNFYKRILREFL